MKITEIQTAEDCQKYLEGSDADIKTFEELKIALNNLLRTRRISNQDVDKLVKWNCVNNIELKMRCEALKAVQK